MHIEISPPKVIEEEIALITLQALPGSHQSAQSKLTALLEILHRYKNSEMRNIGASSTETHFQLTQEPFVG
jgi:hypothetical protein